MKNMGKGCTSTEVQIRVHKWIHNTVGPKYKWFTVKEKDINLQIDSKHLLLPEKELFNFFTPQTDMETIALKGMSVKSPAAKNPGDMLLSQSMQLSW